MESQANKIPNPKKKRYWNMVRNDFFIRTEDNKGIENIE
jgi:hypothetical protein